MYSDDEIREQVREFFLQPKDIRRGKKRSVLALLRRDLQKVYGKENDSPGNTSRPVPLLACLGIMSGFELLSKFYLGKKQATSRLNEFLEGVVEVPSDEARVLLEFRNCLAHGYLLIGKEKKGYLFEVSDDEQETDVIRKKQNFAPRLGVVEQGRNKSERVPPLSAAQVPQPRRESNMDKTYVVNMWPLKKLFLCSLEKYRKKLESELGLDRSKRDLITKFRKCWKEIGLVGIRKG